MCAVDRDRTLVSLTHTAVSLFGSKVVVPETGLLLSNGMIWFDPEPGRPNSIEPGKRALVNMTPFLALRDGAPYLAVGAPGGRKIVSAVPQVLANLIDFALGPQAAVEAPRLHTEGGPVEVDDRMGAATVADAPAARPPGRAAHRDVLELLLRPAAGHRGHAPGAGRRRRPPASRDGHGILTGGGPAWRTSG